MLLEVLESLLNSPGNVPIRQCPRGFDIHFGSVSVVSFQWVPGKESLEPEVPLESIQCWIEVVGSVAWGWAKFKPQAKEGAEVFWW